MSDQNDRPGRVHAVHTMSDGAAFVGTAGELRQTEASLTRPRRQSRAGEPRPKKMTEAKARRLVDAIVAVLECEDIDGTDRVALEDARAAVSPWYDA